MTSKARVLRMDGKEINWDNKQTPTARVMWSKESMWGQRVIGSLRTICHIDRLNNLAISRFDSELIIIQPPYNTTVEASKGTHDFDACFDWYIPGLGWWDMQRFGRGNGVADWYRPTNTRWSNHQHGFTLPPQRGSIRSNDFADSGFKVGYYIDGGYSLYGERRYTSQLDDYYKHAFGLKDMHTPGSDKSWFPPDIGATIFDLHAYVERRRAA
jgi:hypothetical protein